MGWVVEIEVLEESGRRTDSVGDVHWGPYLMGVVGRARSELGVEEAEVVVGHMEYSKGVHDGWKRRKETGQEADLAHPGFGTKQNLSGPEYSLPKFGVTRGGLRYSRFVAVEAGAPAGKSLPPVGGVPGKVLPVGVGVRMGEVRGVGGGVARGWRVVNRRKLLLLHRGLVLWLVRVVVAGVTGVSPAPLATGCCTTLPAGGAVVVRVGGGLGLRLGLLLGGSLWQQRRRSRLSLVQEFRAGFVPQAPRASVQVEEEEEGGEWGWCAGACPFAPHSPPAAAHCAWASANPAKEQDMDRMAKHYMLK
ncbi:hypothetical protein EYF80_035248 [Liparis tanakae]|uniref:Uncharacterized protein n=1 Tax=Liparis tanakae TaxID=230148 RepID=A0A4Z2GMV5_9TELE|nr:hypothetical protein EYF80_035248 [Liparis tanakae]